MLKGNDSKPEMSAFHATVQEMAIQLDEKIEASKASDTKKAYIIISIEETGSNHSIGISVNGQGKLLTYGLAAFLNKEEYKSIVLSAILNML